MPDVKCIHGNLCFEECDKCETTSVAYKDGYNAATAHAQALLAEMTRELKEDGSWYEEARRAWELVREQEKTIQLMRAVVDAARGTLSWGEYTVKLAAALRDLDAHEGKP